LLLIAGRILAALLVVVAVALLVILLVGTTFVNAAATIPSTVTQTLADEEFAQQVAQAALTSVLDRIPDAITAPGITLQKAALLEALKSSDPGALARQIISPDWLRTELILALTRSRSGASADSDGGTGLIR